MLLLCGVAGLEQEAVAALLGLTPENLRQRLRRGRAMIQRQLDDPRAPAGRANREAP